MQQTVVVKIGTSSITDERGEIDAGAVAKLCDEVAAARTAGHRVILVSSGAIAPGGSWPFWTAETIGYAERGTAAIRA